MTAPISHQKKGALWRAYKERPSARYVALTCHVSPHTASKYIKELNFPQRLKTLQQKASTMVSDNEAKRYAEELEKVDKISESTLDTVIEAFANKTLSPSIRDVDRILRLKRFLRGEPESLSSQDVSIEWGDEDDDEVKV
jgi:DNA-binding transcriptional regulator YhcF (GntR family)